LTSSFPESRLTQRLFGQILGAHRATRIAPDLVERRVDRTGAWGGRVNGGSAARADRLLFWSQRPGRSAAKEVTARKEDIMTRLFSALVFAMLLAAPASALEVGQKAPDFSLPGPDGKPVKLSELTAKGPVVLYTFIAAFTPT